MGPGHRDGQLAPVHPEALTAAAVELDTRGSAGVALAVRKSMANHALVLMSVAACILIGQWVDLYWLILPAFSPQAVVLGWTEIGITLGFLGLFGLCLVRFFSRHPVAAVGDPQFESSVRFHG